VSLSLASEFAALPPDQLAAALADLSHEEALALEYDWGFWGRPNQIAPEGDWTFWMLLAGRGFGKTRCGAEWVRREKDVAGRIALVAPTAADARDVMIEGPAGLLASSPPWDRPIYEPSNRRVVWDNGAVATTFSAEEPERLRGPQHHAFWADELGAWKYAEATWDMLMFGFRLGDCPRGVITTTPRPIQVVRDLLKNPACIVTRGSTYDNKVNLAKAFYATVVGKYEGTRLGRQELQAELLDDVPGALWQRGVLDGERAKAIEGDRYTVAFQGRPVGLKRVVVAVDPATTSGEKSDETGIVAAAVGTDGRGYVLEDATCRDTPDGWARKAVEVFDRWRADRIVAEKNQGGDMVENTLRTVAPRVPYTGIHATRGKVLRAEPVSALYEQKRVSHVGHFPALEDQMCEFTADFDPRAAGYSPDRVDALVHALTELMVEAQPAPARAVRLNLMGR
jgi:phage terminase large subunit-like protein